MSKENIKLKKGFTIIETVLVLAIAGLIMALVFLALPALQTGQRDQARKTDANNVSVAIQTYANNNGGNYPYATPATPETYSATNLASCGSTTNKRWTSSGVSLSVNTKTTKYATASDDCGAANGDNISVFKGVASNAGTDANKKTTAMQPNTDFVWVVVGWLCPASMPTASPTSVIQLESAVANGYSNRYSVLIRQEGSNGSIYCVNN